MEKEIITLEPNQDAYKFLPMTSSFVDEYSPEEVPKEIRPTFKLKSFSIKSKREMAKIQMAMSVVSEKMVSKAVDNKLDDKDVDAIIDSLDSFDDIQNLNDKLIDVVRKFVIGWSNFKNIDGDDFEFIKDSEDFLSIDCFLSIPVPLQGLIINRLNEISNLNESEKLGLK